MAAPDFWNDQRSAQVVIRRLTTAKRKLDRLEDLESRLADTRVLVELGQDEQDDESQAILRGAEEAWTKLAVEVERFRLEMLLTGDYDRRSALITLHAGAGGIESQDWVEMLLRMYTRWAQEHGYQVELLDSLEGEEAGLKSATAEVRGDNAYGFLRTERGVHRLVRMSPFDSQNRRHTTFASLDVTPDIETEFELDIDPDELRIDYYRSGGRGGQHVNKTESAVRITHLATGLVATCQSERSQHSNRETAMRILKSRLLKLREQEHLEQVAAIKGEQREAAWGNQIRSYVFQPYSLVKDHRTDVETGNVQAVMDGALDQFIFSFLNQETRAGR